jgi:hypothetical protein
MLKKTDDGNSSASSAVKSQDPRSANASMKPLTRSAMSSSSASMRLGAKRGSSSFRY